jgi:hypothetical protein
VEQDTKAHWEEVYGTKADDEVSWYEPSPDLSLKLVREAIAEGARSVVDIGGGSSRLVDALLDDELDRLAVLDVSETALRRGRKRLGARADRVEWIPADITEVSDIGRFDVWHDRALFHFLTSAAARETYRALAERTVGAQGVLVIATFGPEGPDRCSGLDVERHDVDRLGRELGPSFALRDSQLVDHVTPHGTHQQFLYAVFVRDAASRQRAASV